jgi:hypothetical protein
MADIVAGNSNGRAAGVSIACELMGRRDFICNERILAVDY